MNSTIYGRQKKIDDELKDIVQETSKAERFDVVSRYMLGETLKEIGWTYGWSKGRTHGKRQKKWFNDIRDLIVEHGVVGARRIYLGY